MNQDEVLEWLGENHPDLLVSAELDRNWVWLTADLRSKPEVRQAIKDCGFIFARKGHRLPSGAIGTWGHSCTTPIPFWRKSRKSKAPQPKPKPPQASPPSRFDPALVAESELDSVNNETHIQSNGTSRHAHGGARALSWQVVS